jgi:sialidase-1
MRLRGNNCEMYTFLMFILVACKASLPSPANQTLPPDPSPVETIVFQNGQEGFQCYRIPAIVKAPTGDLLAFAEARKLTCSDHGDVRIVMKRSTDNGKSWGTIQEVANNNENQAGNPAPVFDLTDPQYPQGRLFLFYNTGVVSEQEVRQGKAIREVWYKTSTDGGKTWGQAVNITTQVSKPNKPEVNPAYSFSEDWRSYANTPGHALQLKQGKYRGRIFVAANHSAGGVKPNFKDYMAHGFFSDNHGRTFQLSPDVGYEGSNEAIAAETADGSLLFNCRNQSGDARYRIQAFTKNAGETWTEVKIMTDLPDPVCQGSMIDFKTPAGANILLFTNPSSQSEREKLTIRVSTDDGKTWPFSKEVYSGAAAYSDLVVQQDQQIGILYEKDNYTKIAYVRFSYDWLLN